MTLKGKDAEYFEQQISKNIKQSIDFTEQVKITKKILQKANDL
jgi:hypothetical protein